MGLFGKKDKENEYESAQKAMNQAPTTTARERVLFEQVPGGDDKTLFYVDYMKARHPLVLNFENVKPISEANKILAFLAGATYALGGKVVEIDEMNYIFALKEDYLDGTLSLLLHEIKG